MYTIRKWCLLGQEGAAHKNMIFVFNWPLINKTRTSCLIKSFLKCSSRRSQNTEMNTSCWKCEFPNTKQCNYLDSTWLRSVQLLVNFWGAPNILLEIEEVYKCCIPIFLSCVSSRVLVVPLNSPPALTFSVFCNTVINGIRFMKLRYLYICVTWNPDFSNLLVKR